MGEGTGGGKRQSQSQGGSQQRRSPSLPLQSDKKDGKKREKKNRRRTKEPENQRTKNRKKAAPARNLTHLTNKPPDTLLPAPLLLLRNIMHTRLLLPSCLPFLASRSVGTHSKRCPLEPIRERISQFRAFLADPAREDERVYAAEGGQFDCPEKKEHGKKKGKKSEREQVEGGREERERGGRGRTVIVAHIARYAIFEKVECQFRFAFLFPLLLPARIHPLRDLSKITYARHGAQSRFFVQHILRAGHFHSRKLGRETLFARTGWRDKVVGQTGIYTSRPARSRQALERREAHTGIYALSVGDRANARARPEVCDDEVHLRGRPAEEGRDAFCDVGITEAVETVFPEWHAAGQTLACGCGWDGVSVHVLGQGVVEGRVEVEQVSGRGEVGQTPFYDGDGDVVVQRRKGGERFHSAETRLVPFCHDGRLGRVGAVDDAVGDGAEVG